MPINEVTEYAREWRYRDKFWAPVDDRRMGEAVVAFLGKFKRATSPQIANALRITARRAWEWLREHDDVVELENGSWRLRDDGAA